MVKSSRVIRNTFDVFILGFYRSRFKTVYIQGARWPNIPWRMRLALAFTRLAGAAVNGDQDGRYGMNTTASDILLVASAASGLAVAVRACHVNEDDRRLLGREKTIRVSRTGRRSCGPL